MQQRDRHDRSDLYLVLGVDPSATPVEIRAAYRQRALVLHGDSVDRTRAPAARVRASEMLRELNEAYRALRTPPPRREPDLRGELLWKSVLTATSDELDFERMFYAWLDGKWKRRVDWSVECEHFGT